MTLRRHLSAALAAAALMTFAATAAVAGPWSLAPGEYYTELRGSFFSASSFYDDNGDRMGTNTLFESRSLRSYSELGWKKHLSVQLSLPAVSNTFRDSDDRIAFPFGCSAAEGWPGSASRARKSKSMISCLVRARPQTMSRS